jgi:hypothetical protein
MDYFGTDKYFDFEPKPKSSKKRNQQVLLLFLLAAGVAYYYFMVYLPEEEVRKLETQIQADLDKVKNLRPEEYSNIPTLLVTCQGYLN